MGKWLEILRERPPETLDRSGRLPLILAEISPQPLMEAGRHLGPHRPKFPMLDLVRQDSSAYVDEWLWLDREQMDALLAELRRVRLIGRREEFLTVFDGQRYYDLWRGSSAPEPFEVWLNRIEKVLGAANGRWALLSL
jgi:hypothetical protein